jgi:hypothetical protein
LLTHGTVSSTDMTDHSRIAKYSLQSGYINPGSAYNIVHYPTAISTKVDPFL